MRVLLLCLLALLGSASFAATEHAWPIDKVMGKPDAKITIIEYSSLTCPHCAKFNEEALPRLKKDWIDSGKARLVVRDFARNTLDQAASMIAQCSGDRYFAFLDTYFHSQNNWMTAQQPINAIRSIARLGGMGPDEVDACLRNQKLLSDIGQRQNEGQQLYDITGTPTFVVNGKVVEYDGDYARFVAQFPK